METEVIVAGLSTLGLIAVAIISNSRSRRTTAETTASQTLSLAEQKNEAAWQNRLTFKDEVAAQLRIQLTEVTANFDAQFRRAQVTMGEQAAEIQEQKQLILDQTELIEQQNREIESLRAEIKELRDSHE